MEVYVSIHMEVYVDICLWRYTWVYAYLGIRRYTYGMVYIGLRIPSSHEVLTL